MLPVVKSTKKIHKPPKTKVKAGCPTKKVTDYFPTSLTFTPEKLEDQNSIVSSNCN